MRADCEWCVDPIFTVGVKKERCRLYYLFFWRHIDEYCFGGISTEERYRNTETKRVGFGEWCATDRATVFLFALTLLVSELASFSALLAVSDDIYSYARHDDPPCLGSLI